MSGQRAQRDGVTVSLLKWVLGTEPRSSVRDMYNLLSTEPSFQRSSCLMVSVEVRGELVGVNALLLPYGYQRSNLGCQAYLQYSPSRLASPVPSFLHGCWAPDSVSQACAKSTFQLGHLSGFKGSVGGSCSTYKTVCFLRLLRRAVLLEHGAPTILSRTGPPAILSCIASCC